VRGLVVRVGARVVNGGGL